jgi:hypothetical protein
MWNLTKLDFLFYDFSVIYYNFSKIQRKEIEKEKSKRRYCSKTLVTVAKPPSKTASGCNLNGFEKFRV